MALDQITRALVAEFLKESGLRSVDESRDFERFAAHTLVSPTCNGAIDLPSIMTGNGGDTGLDSIAIVVNGELIADPDALHELIEAEATLDVQYVVVQAETQQGFATAKVGQIGYGVKDFFAEEPTLDRNTAVQDAAETSMTLLQNARLFRNGNPSCVVFYATAGRWQQDNDLGARLLAEEQDLDALNLFSSVSFLPIDAREIQRRYQAMKRGVDREFSFQQALALPDIDAVDESHLGYVPVSELLRIISDESGNLVDNLFYENVRDFQGESNAVNLEISATLADASRRSRFALMNNGITIIAKSVRQTGNRFGISDFQIVNGCQTCNVLWSNRELVDELTLVPLRLIATEDEEVIGDIIRATNRQSVVKEEQFFASSDYMKMLESYFSSVPMARRLFLERRLKQYAKSEVEKTRVIQFNNLVRSFASLVLHEPQRATRNYKQVLARIPDSLLNPAHKPSVYFAAASSLYRLEYLLRNGSLDRRFSPAKWHLLLATRLAAAPRVPAQLNGRDADRWANDLVDFYWDHDQAEAGFLAAASEIERIAGGDLSRGHIRTQPFTDKVIANYA